MLAPFFGSLCRLSLAADQRFRMALQVIREYPDRARCGGQCPERRAHIAADARILGDGTFELRQRRGRAVGWKWWYRHEWNPLRPRSAVDRRPSPPTW